jgi:transcription initiation factor TFIIB
MDQVDDFGPESHSTDVEEKSKNTRASGSTSFSLHDYGLRTEIAFGTKDYSGKSIDYPMAEQLNALRKWHSRIRVSSPKERRLSNILSKIGEMGSALSLPKIIIETAAILYRNFENTSQAKGKSISCMAAASLYLACKRCAVVRSLDEIVAASGLSVQGRSNSKLASKYYRSMVMEIRNTAEQMPYASNERTERSSDEIHYSSSSNGSFNLPPMTYAVDQYIAKLANMSKIDTRVERLAIDIAHGTNDHLLADGKAPNGLAAAYIYLASILLGVNVLQRDISGLAGITEVTIRNRCKDILTSFKFSLRVRHSIKPNN